MKTLLSATSPYALIGTAMGGVGTLGRWGSRIVFAPENEGGAGGGNEGGDDDAAKAAAEKAAAEEAARKAAEAAGGSGDGNDDKKKPSDEEARLLKEVMKTKEKLREADERLKAWDGLDPAEIRKLVAEKKEAEKKAAEAAGDFERVKAMMAEEHGKVVSGLQAQIDALTAQLAEKDSAINEKAGVIDRLTIGSAFDTSKFLTEETVLTPAIARKTFGDHFELVDGRVVAFDKPKGAAERTKLVDASGNELGFEAAIKRLVESDPDKDRLLRSKMKNGAGSNTDPNAKAADAGKTGGLYGAARIAAGLQARKGAAQ